jgi:hypothetical protein
MSDPRRLHCFFFDLVRLTWRFEWAKDSAVLMHLSTFPRLLLSLTLGLLPLSPAQPAEWQPLFNGKDLTGWVSVHDVLFDVQDETLRLVRGTGWLRTEKEYGDFILDVEIRPLVERYDSGLFFRAGLDGKPWPNDGWQVNLRRDMWGALVRGFKKMLDSSVEGPDVDDTTPWSRFRLEVRGTHASLTLEGKQLWQTDAIEPRRGYIGIQAEERSFAFRNFRILELAPQ